MQVNTLIEALACYAINVGLATDDDYTYLVNRLLEALGQEDYTPSQEPLPTDLEEILSGLLDFAVEAGLCQDNITARDLFDTKLMGLLTPPPHEVRKTFREKYEESPEAATDYYYQFSQDTDYIRRYRIKKDMRWKYDCDYGSLDITINLSKPEKDPRAIAAAKAAPQSGYPKCQLCAENEGYAGRMNHPARQNHRIIPITIAGANWYFQYSPYVYYNEHCIVFNREHVPMVIDKAAFRKLLDFVTVMPHYFVGSNADLPIVGGSILSHEHFQGGRYTFAMETAEIETPLRFRGFESVQAGIVKWPMSVIRLRNEDREQLIALADKILTHWRSYSDPSADILSETDGTPHNTITPIARRRGSDYELDLVLRNNRTTAEHPLGLFHPHADKHHIKKENIGLIEVMGLAVLPSRLKQELFSLKDAILEGSDLRKDEVLEKHADWVDMLKAQYTFTPENTLDILLQETGHVFSQVLEDAGVYKRTEEGKAAFLRFVNHVNQG
jgi:UDPglucose--hexose-1-phosphate uridylyltransferase